jgi:hypothetical protein
MQTCSDCEKDLSRTEFSASQLKKKWDKRRCKTCAWCLETYAFQPGAVYDWYNKAFAKYMKENLTRIEDLYDKPGSFKARAIYHRAAEQLGVWCTDEEINEFLLDEDRFQSFFGLLITDLANFTNYIMEAKVACGKEKSIAFCNEQFCRECASDSKCDPSHVDVVHVLTFEDNERMDVFIQTVHRLTVLLALACGLLVQPKADQLLVRLCTEFLGRASLIVSLCLTSLSLTEKSFRKVSHYSAALVSLIIAKRPTAYPEMVGADDDSASVFRLTDCLRSHIFIMLTSGRTNLRDWNYHVTHSVVTILPILYHFGSWRKTHRNIGFINLLAGVVGLIKELSDTIRYAHLSAMRDTTDYQGRKHNSVHLVEQVFIRVDEERLGKPFWRQELLARRPVSFAFAGVLEALGYWASNGLDFDLSQTDFLDSTGCQSMAAFLRRHLETVWLVVRRNPELKYIGPIATALASGSLPSLPDPSISLLYGPLIDSNRRCGLVSCMKTAEEAGLEDLLRCKGCEGLEQYCCREHQREDWELTHRKFCKSNRRSTA